MIQKWVSSLKENSAIRNFLLSKRLNIQLEVEERLHTLIIEDGTVKLSHAVTNNPDVIMKFSDKTFENLILGQVSLRIVTANNLGIIKSSFRNILLLDSIFQIASLSYCSVHKKILD